MIDGERLVVIGDQHARPDRIKGIWNLYKDTVDGYIFAGDLIDGPDTKEAIQMALDMGATLVRGNHEGHLLNAMLEADEENRHLAAGSIWPRVHDRLLQSYGVYQDLPTPGNALRLRDKMPEGHLKFLTDSVYYYEDDKMAIVHADVTAHPWAIQKAYLDGRRVANEHGHYVDEVYGGLPYQLGEGIPEVVESNLTQSGLTKTLLSGHFHRPEPIPVDRMLNSGQHILLATPRRADFSIVYENWTGETRLVLAA